MCHAPGTQNRSVLNWRLFFYPSVTLTLFIVSIISKKYAKAKSLKFQQFYFSVLLLCISIETDIMRISEKIILNFLKFQ